ncbi:glycosyltransferase [Bradyrhizobium icense]|uniref:glycosyltransferase n=1 Tax=Bradyrhizobium icense TaxID=1274631 RepID=UPI0009F48211|nr:glycosyltransferase [Bradyrhizobium icense]
MNVHIESVEVEPGYRLEDYAEYNYLTSQVADLEAAARISVPLLTGRKIWMVSSTRQGGGVAEGLPRVVSLMRQLGLSVEWVVIHSPDPAFFALTKRVHNHLHGVGKTGLGRRDRELYDGVSTRLADEFASELGSDDILIVHDPQPLGMGARLKAKRGLPTIWRCHVGFDQTVPVSEEAWQFLKADVLAYDRSIFTLDAYVPSFLSGKAAIIPPGIDPLTHKNRELSVPKTSGILIDAALAATMHPVLTPPFEAPALRLQVDGSFKSAVFPEDLGLLFRPILTQISRWDRLKGVGPLLDAFVLLKRGKPARARSDRHQLSIDHARLVLAGPEPEGVQDDPEALEVLTELCERWSNLPPELKHEIAILKLPLASVKQNALMVNALQRCSTVVVQNSVREGFGLTVAEAMWKTRPVMGGAAAGIRAQLVDGTTGRLVDDPGNA